MNGKAIRKIFFWILASLILIIGITFSVGYFYYSKIIQKYLVEAVSRESKGLYHAEIGDLNLNVISGNLTLEQFSLVPDTAFYRIHSATDSLAPMLFGLSINQFQITGFKIMDAYREKKINVSSIRFAGPEVKVFRMKIAEKAKEDKHQEKMMSIPLPKGLSSIDIKEFVIKNSKLEFYDCSQDSITQNIFPTCNIFIKNILVDSVHQGKRRLFNADDIKITVSEYKLPLKNGMNEISFGEIGLSTGTEEIYVKDFHLKPLFSKHDYTRKLGFQTDRMDVRINKIQLQRLNLRKLLFEGSFMAGLLEVDSLVLEDYRDKRVPPKPGFKPPMPQDGLRKLKSYLKIDTLLVKSGKVYYSEQVGKVPGTIFLDKMNCTFTGITNDSLMLKAGLISKLKTTAYLMGKGKLDVNINFKFYDPQNAFNFSVKLGSMDLTEVNPMLSNLLPVRVESGKIKQLLVPNVNANDDFAKGELLFYYNDLAVSMKDEKQTGWTKLRTGAINLAANDLVLNDNNPTKAGKMKTGEIYFKRDKEKGIINFLFKSVLSGLKSTMGFNSKEQKEMKKEMKKEARHKKK